MDIQDFGQFIADNKKIVISAIEKNLNKELHSHIDDILQEVFLKAYKSLLKSEFKEESKFSTYLYAIARNLSIDYNRRHANYSRLQNQIETNVSDKSAEEEVLANYSMQSLYTSIDKLPKDYRNILLLSLDGLKDKEVASRLQLNLTTMKSRKIKAKQLLAEMLKEQEIFAS